VTAPSAGAFTVEEQMDRLLNLDMAARGVDHLYQAARERTGQALVLAAAERLSRVPRRSVVIITTGSASRAWISPAIAENDGPAGAAVVARALALAHEAIPVRLVERRLFEPVGEIFKAAGLNVVSLEEARRTAMPGGTTPVVVLRDYPEDDTEGKRQASAVLDELEPSLVFSTERAGRNIRGIYHNARGVDYGMGRARVDYLFDEALRRGISSVAVGDGGNEIGMGLISDAVSRHVAFGDRCSCGCGAGIGAVTSTDVLVTAACSNWGCYGIVACLAGLLANTDLLHTPDQEELLLRRGVDVGLINATNGRIEPNPDGIPMSSHRSIVELLREMAVRQIRVSDLKSKGVKA
jgi:D-glutamate cyclase